jgi:hypothetical protein
MEGASRRKVVISGRMNNNRVHFKKTPHAKTEEK